MTVDRMEYRRRCERRWSGVCFRDAAGNWPDFESMREDLTAALRQFRGNPLLKDVAGRCHNESGSLKDFLWRLQSAWQPDPVRLDPLLDFCEDTQSVHLRRGLLFYCELILEALERVPAAAEGERCFEFWNEENVKRKP